MKNTLALMVGIYFGIVLIKSEVASWFRIQHMFHFEEAHMYLVLCSAVLVGAISLQIIRRLRMPTLAGEAVPPPEKMLQKGAVIGGIIFGIGWAITGARPGPIYAQIGSGEFLAILSFAGAFIGASSLRTIALQTPALRKQKNNESHRRRLHTHCIGARSPPPCGDEQVLVDIYASAVNRADLLQRAGHYPPPPGASPYMGLEMSGVISAVGSAVEGWQVGDRVLALLSGGGYAEQVALPAAHLMPLPADWDFAKGAAVPEVFLTAFVNLFFEAQLAPGEVALVHGGASGVGTAAIQLARAAGRCARTSHRRHGGQSRAL